MVALAPPSAGRITEAFGPRPKPTPTSPPLHYGIDYGWGNGLVVKAAAAGTVAEVADAGSYGRRIRIRHSDGTETWYCHLVRGSELVRAGQYVAQGQHLATMGATGNVTGVHLHFEYRVQGYAVDPAPYLSTTTATDRTPIMAALDDTDKAWITVQLVSLFNQTKAHLDFRIDRLFIDDGDRELDRNISLLNQMKAHIDADPDMTIDAATVDQLIERLAVELVPQPVTGLPAAVADEIDRRTRERLEH